MKKIKNFFKKLFGDKSMTLINILLIVVAAVIIALVVYGVWRVRQTPWTVEQPAEISEEMPDFFELTDQNQYTEEMGLNLEVDSGMAIMY